MDSLSYSLPKLTFSRDTPCKENNEQAAQEFLRYLFTETPLSSFPFSLLKALFIKDDPCFQKAFFCELEKAFVALYTQVSQNPNEELALAVTIEIGNLLAILAFVDIGPNQTIQIPRRQADGTWKLENFTIEKIALTPSWLTSPLIAYGLKAQNCDEQLLLFRGTCYFTAEGSLLAFWSDFIPLTSPGTLTWKLFAKKRIAAWLQKHPGKVNVYGKSLGGAFCLLCHRDFAARIKQVHAYNPAANLLPHKACKNSIFIYKRQGDIAFYLGRYDPSWNVQCIATKEKGCHFLTHVRAYPGLQECTLTKIDPQKKPILRFSLNLFHTLIAVPIFAILTPALVLRKLINIIIK